MTKIARIFLFNQSKNVIYLFCSWLEHHSAFDIQLLLGILRSDQLLHIPRRPGASTGMETHFPGKQLFINVVEAIYSMIEYWYNFEYIFSQTSTA